MSDNTFCASRCCNYDCEKHASNVEPGWMVYWKDLHHSCKDFQPFDVVKSLSTQEGD